MSETRIPTKSRFEIIDTALNRQQEKKILRYLILLFCLTFGYEVVWPAYFGPVEAEKERSEAISATAKNLSLKRLVKLRNFLKKLAEEDPMLRQRIEAEIVNLSSIQDFLHLSKNSPEAQKEFETFLERLWKLFHLPYWDDPEKFQVGNTEIALFLKMLGKNVEMNPFPEVIFEPKLMWDLKRSRRDIFNYAQ